MSRVALMFCTLVVAACASNQHVDAPKTTSAAVGVPTTSAAPQPSDDTTTPFDLPKNLLRPNAVNPRPEPDPVDRDTRGRDRNITAAIRKAVQDDPNLSPEAKDIEISVSDRKVVLHGRVKTEQERMDIDAKARAADGTVDVDDRIELVP
jgi:hypothetical protein